MRFSGKEILENKELSDFLLNSCCRVLEITWHDGSKTKCQDKEIYIEIVENKLNLVEGLWSHPINSNIELLLEMPNLNLYKVFTLSEAAAIWGKDESTLRRSLYKFHPFIEYRKAGRITLIEKDAMIRVYGDPSTS